MKTKEISQDLWINIITIIAVLLLAFNITVAKEKPDKTLKATYTVKLLNKAENLNSTMGNFKKSESATNIKNGNTTNVYKKYKFPIINRIIKNYKLPINN